MPSVLLLTSPSLAAALQEQLRHVPEWQLLDSPTDRTIDYVVAESGVVSDAQLHDLHKTLPESVFLLIGSWTIDLSGSEIIPTPVRLGYLLARLGHHARLQAHRRTVMIHLGPYQFHPRERKIIPTDGNAISLSDKESELLEMLCFAPDKLHRQDLLREVWGYDGSLDTHTLETHIYRLRRKLPLPDEQDLFLVSQGTYQLNPLLRTA